jgi:hypothetical protein
MNDCKDYTIKIVDLDKPQVDLLLGEMIRTSRRIEEKRKQLDSILFDRVSKDLMEDLDEFFRDKRMDD